MTIRINPACLARTKWHEYAVRFVFGGLITAAAGLIAHRYGPAIGGLFLAFPASPTLVEKHETQKKKCAGLQGVIRGREAATVDAVGAALGCIGLAGFATVVWQLLVRMNHGSSSEMPACCGRAFPDCAGEF
jgi:hypothetical protein